MKNLMILPFILYICINTIFAQGGKTSLYFAGGNDIVWCGNDSTLGIQDAITLEAWIKSDGPNHSWARILDKFNFHARQGYNLVRRDGTGSIRIDAFTTDNAQHPCDGVSYVFDNNWHYVATTFNGTEFITYIDGKIENKKILDTQKRIKICPEHFAIGNGWDGATWFPYRGQIDEARVWDEAVDSSTIRYWMHRDITKQHPYYEHLMAYWKFNEGGGSVTFDSSAQSNHGTLSEMDTLTVWLNSSIPLATDMTNQLHNLSAVWAGSDSAWSSIFFIKGNNFNNNASVLFGHDNGTVEWIDSGVPGNKNILNRLNRVWRVEAYDTMKAKIMFDLSVLPYGHEENLTILVDSDGEFENADTLNGIIDSSRSVFIVSDTTIQHCYYYTIGARENLLSLEKITDSDLPKTFHLHQNYPNPFNPSTTIEFTLHKTDFIELLVYNILGKNVSTLVSNRLNCGNYAYKFDGGNLVSGVYYYRIEAGNFVETRKMVYLK